MAEEIALFIDFENIRYSLLNTQHREPDPQELINVARRYGTVMVAKAYADWSRQPEMFKGSLTAAMIDRVDCPAKQRDRYRSGWQQSNNATNGSWRETNDPPPNWAASSANLPANGHTRGEGEEAEDTPEVLPAIGAPSTGAPVQYGTQSTVDLNMLMDIIETVFDRPSITHFVLMTGDRDFTRICARLKLRLNKFVVVAGVPGTVSRDLTAAANQFVLLGNHTTYGPVTHSAATQYTPQGTIEPSDPQFLQFLDYIDRHWAWRTIIGVSNFIGDPYNHKNRFRGRLTRESARDLLQACVQQGILIQQTDPSGNEDLRLNRANPAVESALASVAQQQGYGQQYSQQPYSAQPPSSSQVSGPYSQMGPWTGNGNNYAQTSTSSYVRRIASGVDGDIEEEIEEIDEIDEQDASEEESVEE